MNDMTISGDEIKAMGRIVSDQLPEYAALKNRLRAESPNVRRAVANVLSEWAFDPTADMSADEKRAYLSRIKVELAFRSRDFSGLSSSEAEQAASILKDELRRRGESVD